MAITISPLDLYLDENNPRFVILTSRSQAEIRKYLVTNEDVLQLVRSINEYGGLLPGERIVVLKEDGRYVVIEGNRRTCSLQMLLSRDLIPDGFGHRIPSTTQKLIDQCTTIEVDVLGSRDAALELMSKRHIEGVMEWKPLAKKQFFAANYKDGNGQSVHALSQITGIKESDIKSDIREYKLFHSAYEKYAATHPDFNREIVGLKTDPFWRIFKAKFPLPDGHQASPREFLKISYDETFNAISSLPDTLFEQITQLVFEQAIVQERINTRHTLSDVEGIWPLLQAVIDAARTEPEPHTDDNDRPTDHHAPNNPPAQPSPAPANTSPNPSQQGSQPPQSQPAPSPQTGNPPRSSQPGGPQPNGPAPRMFFETLNWQRLNPSNLNHQGLLLAINELHKLSTKNCERQKAYNTFPNATGMILRTVYEQALRLRLNQVGLWGAYCSQLNGRLPTLSGMEAFISQTNIKSQVFPDADTARAYKRVIDAGHRDFLNATIHNPGSVSVTAGALESLAADGMYYVIQWILDETT